MATPSSPATDADKPSPPVFRDPRIPRYPVIYEHPTFEQVKDNVSPHDLVSWGVVGTACFPLGYAMTRQIDRRLATRGMWFMGVLGVIGGGLLAYQNTELRLQGFGCNDRELERFRLSQTSAADVKEPTERSN